MKLKLAAVGLLFTPLVALTAWSLPAEATRGRTVDCAAGDSIQQRMDAAVASADQGEAVIINLASDCRQDVIVTGDNVTIRTSPKISRARLRGTITFDGAQRFAVDNLRVSGASYGILARNSASGEISDVRVDGNERSGILVTAGANVTVTDSRIDNKRSRFAPPRCRNRGTRQRHRGIPRQPYRSQQLRRRHGVQ